MSSDSSKSSDKRYAGRVCDPSAFMSYFSLSPPSNELSEAGVSLALAKADSYTDFSQALVSLTQKDKVYSFLDKLYSDCVRARNKDAIPKKHIPNIIRVLINLGDSFVENDAELAESSELFFIASIINSLLKRIIDENERYKILKDAIGSAEDSLYTGIFVINFQEYKNKSNKGGAISAEQLDKLKKLACEKIKKLADSGLLLKHKKLAAILTYWGQWGEIDQVIRFAPKLISAHENLDSYILPLIIASGHRDIFDYDFVQLDSLLKEIAGQVPEEKFRDALRKGEYSEEQKQIVNEFLETVYGTD